MNDYRHRPNYNRRFEPASSTSMGRFFSNRLRDSLYLGGPLPTTTTTTTAAENFDQTTADNEATPEPPVGLYDLQRSVVTPSSTSSNNDSYFTHTSRDIHKFSRRVELSSGYNILKNRTSSRPARLPTFLQGRAPLAQLNPLPAATTMPTNQLDETHQRRLSFTDHQRTQSMTYNQQILQQFNIDGTRRPFSSDSPLPPPPMPAPAPSTLTGYYISSAPPMHNRIVYDPIEPLKLPSEQEDNSIAALSRELRAAAYPTTRKSSHHSPTRETSPLTSRYSTRTNPKRAPRSLPKLGTAEVSPPPVVPAASTTSKMAPFFHHHEMERNPLTTEHRVHSSSAASLLLDQFFSSDQTPAAAHELTSTGADKSSNETHFSDLCHEKNSALNVETGRLFILFFSFLLKVGNRKHYCHHHRRHHLLS